MYQGWTAEMYRNTNKDEQIKVNQGYREEQNKRVERCHQNERENANKKNIMSPFPQQKKQRT